jgi:hypothetical protein
MKGAYEVLSIDRNTMRIRWDSGEEITTAVIDRNTMRIRWDSGEEITTTVSLQSKIVTRMGREQRKREEAK